VIEKVSGSVDERDRPLLDLTWDYETDDSGDADPEAVLAEINGRFLTGEDAGKHLSSYTQMRADGTNEGGCWIYTGIYADGVNQADSRPAKQDQSSVFPECRWAWPANLRILYNRASAHPAGNPMSELKNSLLWN